MRTDDIPRKAPSRTTDDGRGRREWRRREEEEEERREEGKDEGAMPLVKERRKDMVMGGDEVVGW